MKTKCNCRHWSQCGVIGGGCCAKKLYGGRPSLGVCEICNDYTGSSNRISPERWRNNSNDQQVSESDRWINAASKIANGAISLAKSAIGMGITSAEVIDKRRGICYDCEHISPCIGKLEIQCCGRISNLFKKSTASTCSCIINRKIRIANQKCPVGKW